MSNSLIKDSSAGLVLVEHAEWVSLTLGAPLPAGEFVAQIVGGIEIPIGGAGVSIFATALKRVTYTYEAVPDAWNAGARSVVFCVGDCAATFKVPVSTVGALCGLAHFYGATGSQVEVVWGFLVKDGQITAYSNTGVPTLLPDVPSGSTVYKLIRRGAQISYYVDDVLRFTATDPAPSLAIFMAASLLAPDDSVTDPALRDLVDVDMVLPYLKMSAYQGASYASAVMQMLPLTMSSLPASGATLVMQPLVPGAKGGATMSMRPLRLVATAGVHGAQMEMQPMQMLAIGQVYGDATMRSFVGPATTLAGNLLIFALMDEQGEVAATLLATPLLSAEAISAVDVATALASGGFINALMRSVVLVGADVPLSDDGGEAWVVNSNTNASSKYEGYAFNSFARVGDSYYGARSDGIYLLDGETDNGQPIRASVSLGRHNFGTLNKKRINAVAVAASSSDTLYLKVIVEQGAADEQEYVYAARNFKQAMSTQRMNVGRGIRASYLTFELFNHAGSDFELEQAKFEIVDTNRSTG